MKLVNDFDEENRINLLLPRGDKLELTRYHTDHLVAGDSVTGDTMVRMRGHGKVNISDLFTTVDHTKGDKEYHVPEDQYVLSYDWRTNETCYKKVKYVMRHWIESSYKKVYRCSINNLHHVDVTEDHSLMAFKSKWAVNKKETERVDAGQSPPFFEVRPSDVRTSLITLKRTLPDVGVVPDEMQELSPLFYEFLGFFVGDGSCSLKFSDYQQTKDHTVVISFGIDKVEGLTKLIEPLVDSGMITHFSESGNGFDIKCCPTDYRLVRHFITDTGKCIPSWLKYLNEDQVSSFLRGYFSADGGVMVRGGRPIVRLTSTLLPLIMEVRELLLGLGVANSIYSGKTENAYNAKLSGTFSKYLIIKDIGKFANTIGFTLERKQSMIAEYEVSSTRSRVNSYDFSISRLKGIEELTNFQGYVYDIEVEDTHVFFANDILVHNTDSGMFDISHIFDEDEDEDLVVDFADTVGKMTNDAFPEHIQRVFNVPDSRRDAIKTDREIVASAALYFTKKRYAMKVIDSEGKRGLDWKIMGLEIKKADVAPALKEFLKELTYAMVEGEDMATVDKMIADFKKAYFKMKHDQIGRPMPTKSLKKYQDIYEMTGDMKGFPYHVRAALFYNSLCGQNDTPIRLGDKFYLVYVKDSRSKYIGVPLDLNTYPDFLYDIPIDYEANWKSAKKKITNYLESLDWHPAGRRETKAKALFGI